MSALYSYFWHTIPPYMHTHMLFSRFCTLLCALVTVDTAYTIYFVLIHHCTNSLSSLHIFVHHCTFCALPLYCIVSIHLYSAVHTNQKRFQCEKPRDKRWPYPYLSYKMQLSGVPRNFGQGVRTQAFTKLGLLHKLMIALITK